MKTNSIINNLVLFGLFVLIFSGCATQTKKADYMDPTFKVSEIDFIYVMPVLDFRFDQEEKMPLDEWVRDAIKRPLEKKNYKHTFFFDRSIIPSIESEMLREPNPVWLSDCGPTEARWLLFFALEDVSSQLTFGSTGNAEMSAYIFDKLTNNLVWQNKEIGRVGQGGLIGMMVAGSMKRSAILKATDNLLQGLPEREE